ncbi:MAG: restriction endonuclease [Candidatus Methanomethyliaceae archaeon]
MKSYTLQLQDEDAISTLEQFPEEERSRVAAKYIIIGDTVVRYAAIVTSEASLQKYFEPITTNLRTLSENLESTRKQLEGRIPETIQANLSGVIEQIKAAATSLATLHEGYQDLFSKIIPELAKSKPKGDISCEAVFQSLQSAFKSDSFEDVSSEQRYMDILGIPSFGQEPIYIEVKDYSDTVETKEVNKFWRDMEARNARVGCFISIRTPIRKVTNDFCIVTRGSKQGVFVVSEAMGKQGHIIGYMVARKLLEMMWQGTISTEKYELVARILNRRIQEFKDGLRDLEQIEKDIEQARTNLDNQLNGIAKRTSNLRGTLEKVVNLTLQDFAEASQPGL